MQTIDEWLALFQALVGGKPVDFPLDIEQRIDPFDGLQRHGRDRRGFLSTFGIRRDVDEHEEFTTRVRPTQCLRQSTKIAINLEQRVVAAIGIRLQNAGEGLQVAFRMFLPSISRCVVKCGRR